jgi:hypothetical protein
MKRALQRGVVSWISVVTWSWDSFAAIQKGCRLAHESEAVMKAGRFYRAAQIIGTTLCKLVDPLYLLAQFVPP